MTRTSRVLCDMRSASDTPEQRMAEYRKLFDAALCGRDRSERMVRFRFRRAVLDEEQLRSLAARERVCCPFFDLRVIATGDELWWEIRVDDVDEAKIMLDEFALLPEQLAGHVDVANRLIEQGSMLAPRSNGSGKHDQGFVTRDDKCSGVVPRVVDPGSA